MARKKSDSGQGVERPVSLAPLDLGQALSGLLAVKQPTKPEKPKRKTPAPPPEE